MQDLNVASEHANISILASVIKEIVLGKTNDAKDIAAKACIYVLIIEAKEIKILNFVLNDVDSTLRIIVQDNILNETVLRESTPNLEDNTKVYEVLLQVVEIT